MALQYGAYIAMAAIGLYAIFAGEMISILNYMLEPAVEPTLEDDFLKPRSMMHHPKFYSLSQ